MGETQDGGTPPTLENATKWVVDYVRHNFRPRFDITQQDEDSLLETLRESYVGDVVRAALGRSVPQDGLSVICRDCGYLIAGVEAGDRVHFVTCRPCFERGGRSVPAEPTPEAVEAANSAEDTFILEYEHSDDADEFGRIRAMLRAAYAIDRGAPTPEQRAEVDAVRRGFYKPLGAPPQVEPPPCAHCAGMTALVAEYAALLRHKRISDSEWDALGLESQPSEPVGGEPPTP